MSVQVFGLMFNFSWNYALQRTTGLKVDSVQYCGVSPPAGQVKVRLITNVDRLFDLGTMGNIRESPESTRVSRYGHHRGRRYMWSGRFNLSELNLNLNLTGTGLRPSRVGYNGRARRSRWGNGAVIKRRHGVRG